MKKTTNLKRAAGGALVLLAVLLCGSESHNVLTAGILLGSLWAGTRLVSSTLK